MLEHLKHTIQIQNKLGRDITIKVLQYGIIWYVGKNTWQLLEQFQNKAFLLCKLNIWQHMQSKYT